jgi:hypothetical protein
MNGNQEFTTPLSLMSQAGPSHWNWCSCRRDLILMISLLEEKYRNSRNLDPLGILVPLSKIDVHLPVTFDEPGVKLIEKYLKIDRLIKIPSMFATPF